MFWGSTPSLNRTRKLMWLVPVTREQKTMLNMPTSGGRRHHPTERDCSSCRKGREVAPVVRPCTFGKYRILVFHFFMTSLLNFVHLHAITLAGSSQIYHLSSAFFMDIELDNYFYCFFDLVTIILYVKRKKKCDSLMMYKISHVDTLPG